MRSVLILVALAALSIACKEKPTADTPPAEPSATEPAAEAQGQEGAKDEVPPPSPEQGFAEAMAIVCNAPSQSGMRDMAAADKASAVAKHIEARVGNAEVKAMFADLANMDAAKRRDVVAAAAEKAGIEGCEILALWAE